jgi:hypothetical protein
MLKRAVCLMSLTFIQTDGTQRAHHSGHSTGSMAVVTLARAPGTEAPRPALN